MKTETQTKFTEKGVEMVTVGIISFISAVFIMIGLARGMILESVDSNSFIFILVGLLMIIAVSISSFAEASLNKETYEVSYKKVAKK